MSDDLSSQGNRANIFTKQQHANIGFLVVFFLGGGGGGERERERDLSCYGGKTCLWICNYVGTELMENVMVSMSIIFGG